MSLEPEHDRELVALREAAKNKGNPDSLSARVTGQLADAREKLLELTAGDLSTADLQGAQAEQSRRCWELEALAWQLLGKLGEAAECSKQAVAQGKLAISFGKATIVDRVAELERRLAEDRQQSSKVRAAAAARRK